MITPELLEGIKKSLASGKIPTQIEQEILANGWSRDDASAAFAKLGVRGSLPQSPRAKWPWLVLIAGLLVIGWWQFSPNLISGNWKIYRDDGFGIELKYPKKFFGYKFTQPVLGETFLITDVAKTDPLNAKDFRSFSVTKSGIKFADYLETRREVFRRLDIDVVEQEVTIAGIRGIRLMVSKWGNCSDPRYDDKRQITCRGLTTVLEYNGKTFDFDASLMGGGDFNSFLKLYDQILSRVRFL